MAGGGSCRQPRARGAQSRAHEAAPGGPRREVRAGRRAETADDRMHLVILDVRGQTVIVQAYGGVLDTVFASDIDSIRPIIESFRFTPGG